MPRLLPLGLVAGALAVAVVTTGCSSSKNATATPSTSAVTTAAATAGTTTAASAAASGAATTVTVTETEYALHLSQSTFAPGTYTFVAQDSGHISHALAISGPGVQTVQTSTIEPGGNAKLTVTLQKGSYEIWCPVDSHKSLGMDTHIQVS